MGIRLNSWLRGLALLLLGCVPCPQAALAQSYSEDFTGSTTTNLWYFTGGACLTAGNVAGGGAQPGPVASCASVLNSYYVLQKDGDPKLVGGDQGTVPDNAGTGALRFTNGSPYGHNESGAIVSGFAPFPTTQGVSISFKTITYEGDSGGGGQDGADGISFFLMDGCVPLAGATNPAGCAGSVNYGAAPAGGQVYKPLGAIGGSLGYSCSNSNPLADGLIGAYLGLGIDEYGNFLNGTKNTLGETGSTNPGGDNTTTGGFYQPGRIGLRGSGSVNFQLLTYLYGTDPNSSSVPYYPKDMNTTCPSGSGVYEALNGKCQTCDSGATYSTTTHSCPSGNINDNPTYGQAAIQHACSTGMLYNNKGYASGTTPTSAGNLDTTNTYNTSKILNYTAIPNGYTVLSSSNPIANESATVRNQTVTPLSKRATPIVYNLSITQDGIMNFSLSYNGGSWQNILTNADIKATNGPLPPSFRFGFAGSTGGSTNIHEVLCFKATPNDLALNSGGVNDFQNPQIVKGTQLFLASYFPTKAWAGAVTALDIGFDTKNKTVAVASTPNWDASCVLTGGGTCPSGAPSSIKPQANRVMLTWDSKKFIGEAFESASISTQQQSALDGDDPSGAAAAGSRLNFLRGDQSNEIPKGLKLFRTRTSVLGDIIDSSPTLVGPPSTYPANIQWVDLLNQKGSQPEASGESYATFQNRNGIVGRQNVVYVGANDGFLHGFAAGSFDKNGIFVNNPTTPNDGHEVLAYMPGAISMIIHNTGTPSLDYSSTQYKHAYFVDATPGTGDVFYNKLWHTWLVGGFGVGGPGIYALDVTDPSSFSEANTAAANTVIVEWTPSSINGGCGNNSSCGDSMGTISGVPQIRRFHTGQWGFVFGNGLNSASGDAGIFVALLDKDTGKPSLLYFSAAGATKASPQTNGIVAVSAADIDSDHIVDFVYAGDVKGNLWRFDLTGSQTSQWKLSSPGPLFKEPFGNPITTQVTVSTLRTIETHLGSGAPSVTRKPERIILNFGTGQQIPQANNLPAQYSSTQQYLYGIWDGDFNDWNTQKPAPIQPVVSLGANAFATITSQSSLVKQTITENDASTPAFRSMSTNTICWADVKGCSQYGWYVPLIGTNEQIIFDPIISPDGAFVVNTFIPSTNDTLSCSANLPTGFTMAIQPDSGSGAPTPFFFINSNQNADGIQLNGTGVPSLVMSGQSADGNAEYVLTQTSNGTSAPPAPTNRHVITVGQRMNWIERR